VNLFLRVEAPIKLESWPNKRMHYMTKASLVKAQRETIRDALYEAETHGEFRTPAKVIITRTGPFRLDDDNCTASGKPIRDQVAATMGINDGSEQVEWIVKQEKSKAYGVVVEVWC
jgi:hypothetical protein